MSPVERLVKALNVRHRISEEGDFLKIQPDLRDDNSNVLGPLVPAS